MAVPAKNTLFFQPRDFSSICKIHGFKDIWGTFVIRWYIVLSVSLSRKGILLHAIWPIYRTTRRTVRGTDDHREEINDYGVDVAVVARSCHSVWSASFQMRLSHLSQFPHPRHIAHE